MITLYDRQLGLFDPTNYMQNIPVVIVGAGTIGSWTTLALAKMGVSDITVVDDDVVEEQNIPNQLYSDVPFSIKAESNPSLKVNQLREIVQRLTSIREFYIEPKRFDEKVIIDTIECVDEFILISAVDSMKSRSEIWELAKKHSDKIVFYIDGRVGGNVAKTFSVVMGNHDWEWYEKTLHSDDLSFIKNKEAKELSDLPCTMRSIVDVSMSIAGVITNLYRMYVTGKHPLREISLDLSNGYSLNSYDPEREDTQEEEIPI